jgi:hypothetical protein
MAKVSSYRELMAEQARAAVRVTGADHSSWNGKVGPTNPNESVDGLAEWDHTIRYSEANVSEPLQEMFSNARAHNQDRATLRSYRKALKTMLHENVHVLAARGSDHFQGQKEYNTPAGRIAEESFTELYSLKKLDDYIDDLGLEEIAPGIKDVPTAEIYRRYLPGAQAFADHIGNRSGVGSDEVIHRMAIVNAEQKFQVAAAAIYDNSKLPGLVPSDQRDASIDRIANAMKPAFAGIENATANPGLQRRQAAGAGGAAAEAGYKEAQAIRRMWAKPAPGSNREPFTQVQQSQQAQQSRIPESGRVDMHTGQAAPQSTPVGAGAGPPAASAQGPNAGPNDAPASRSGELEQAMRAGLGGSAPLAGAKVLSADQQGSRRSDTQTGQQRQGPERES